MTAAPARRRGRPPAAAAERTRERIVRAAVELFAEKGFHGTGVAEIGDRADVQRGALYYHIGSKEELLFQILRDYTAVMHAEATAIAASADDPITKLRKLIHSHLRLVIEHRREVAIQLRDVSALTGERGAQLQELRDLIQRRWQDVIDAGRAAGTLRTADHVVTNGILAMLNSVTLWYRPHGGRSPDQIADILASTVLDGLVDTTDTKG
ncbi:TetR/AcrR family transcriptional regulator [Nocardia pseudobrasiliensis]|uniref:TetR family transcriptional regulator n=1 Tax=Nocardia pseudobrasiliensis TaxID=45979 RepID=A0A370IAF3_9NOCA|nr:TetR/AcrR family transcriptional regulator [Nocardia pseudobrasiliensis]RDI67693.1 TetR family transcriptional regulator [Nocardia pseudobrasiliensis]